MLSTNTAFDEPPVHIEFDWTCKVCGKPFHSALDLPAIIADVVPKPTICNFCGEALKQKAEMEQREASWRAKSLECGVPDAFLSYDKARGNTALFSRMKENWNASMFISGAFDSGKSRALAYCVTRWIAADRGLRIRFCGWADLCEQYAALTSKSLLEANQFKKELLQNDILAVDDFGKRRPTPVMEDFTYELVNGFYESGRRLWMTSNKSLAEALKVYSNQDIAEAVISRFDRMIRDGSMIRITV